MRYGNRRNLWVWFDERRRLERRVVHVIWFKDDALRKVVLVI
jgi:hypothetical protein